MLVLGLNAFHGDSSACLLRDGRIVAAAEEERFRRLKHWAGFPSEAIRYCLQEAGATLRDLDHVAVNQDSKANRWRRVVWTARNRPDMRSVVDRLKRRRNRASIARHFAMSFSCDELRAEVHHVEHHLSHLASAYFASRFDHAAAVSVDGFGDFASAAWGLGRGGDLHVDDRVFFPHSLGLLYQAVTQYLGFHQYGDEYKVMGLAPYGRPRYMDQVRRMVHLDAGGHFRLNLDFFRHSRERIEFTFADGSPQFSNLYSSALEDLLGPARKESDELADRHRDIAASIQMLYEEAFFHLLAGVHSKYGVDNLALAGGCAMNSVANGKVVERTPFRRLYVQAAAGDAGGAMGAAMVVWKRSVASGQRPEPMDHAYWGPSYKDTDFHEELERRKAEVDAAGCQVIKYRDTASLATKVASAIAQGAVVGWFQGRMEWGPRALGNRSILCDPRRSDAKDLLNAKIKRRESFRPFAPSILREAVPDWFEVEDDVPFMTHVFPIKEERRRSIPAVTHVDGSGRLQTVSREANPLYYDLIAAFRDITGVPMLLNTSFNESEPIVCRPGEALDCFLRTRMDYLVLGNYVVNRPNDIERK
jgi:carbamoyltransferase